MKKSILLLWLLCSVAELSAQIIDNDLLNDLKARSIGPGGMSGRVTSIAVDSKDPAVFYIGTASGGIWKTANGGINFDPVFDDKEVAGIGAICVDPNNSDIIWAGTGEGNPRNSITGGYGLYKSIDAGRTWKLMGLEKTRHIHRVIVHPQSSNIIYVGAIGSPWGPHSERGVYKSTDGGESWQKILYVNELTGVADMMMDPHNPDKLFVAMWEHIRHPWFFKSGGPGSGLYSTIDGGKNWKEITSKEGLPEGELGRMGLAISNSNPDYVYALVESKKNAIYRSVDGGYKWEKRGEKNIGDRPFYYADIFVDPSNENRLYSLYSRVNVSEDGGNSFRTLIGNNIHSDHHAWWIYPLDPSFMIDGNDGGMAISYDKGENWRHVSNLPVSQFYHISVDDDLPYNVYGGMQDNGSWKGPSYVWSRDGIINEYWDFLLGGDGFDVQAVPGDNKYCYAMSQGGNLMYVNTETGSGLDIMPAETDVKLRWHWNAALSLDPFDQNTLYYGSQFLHKSTDRGRSWATISGDLTCNDTSRQKFNKSGGLTYDVTGAETYNCILAIAPSPLKEGVIWVGTDDGNIQLTRDGGTTWTNCSGRIKNYPDQPWIPQIVASLHNDAEAFVVVNNYRQNDYKPYLYHTTDYGKTWGTMVDEKDVSGYVLSFIQDPVVENLMFLGTEFGLYVSLNKGRDWEKWTNGFPTVSTMDLAIQSREADLVIGTFGRSAYVIDDLRPLRKWAIEGDAFKNHKISAFETPNAYMASSKNAPGYYFHGDGYYMGENRRMGAEVSFFVREGLIEKDALDKGSPKPDTMLIEIFDENDEIVRCTQFVPDKGLNRFYWSFDRDGINLDFGPGRNRKNKFPGGGGYVFPGDYKIKMTYMKDSAQTVLTVLPDPREEYNLEAQIKRQVYIDQTMQELESFNKKVRSLNKCSRTVSTIASLAQDQASDSLKTELKEIEKELKDLAHELNGEENVQGIFTDEDLFVVKVRPLLYLAYSSDPITENQLVSLNKAKTILTEMDRRIDTFLKDTWEEFKVKVEKENLSLF